MTPKMFRDKQLVKIALLLDKDEKTAIKNKKTVIEKKNIGADISNKEIKYK